MIRATHLQNIELTSYNDWCYMYFIVLIHGFYVLLGQLFCCFICYYYSDEKPEICYCFDWSKLNNDCYVGGYSSANHGLSGCSLNVLNSEGGQDGVSDGILNGIHEHAPKKIAFVKSDRVVDLLNKL